MGNRKVERKKEKWYGFTVTKNPQEQECSISLKEKEYEAIVRIKDEGEVYIGYIILIAENMSRGMIVNTEKDIALYLYQECMKYVNFSDIYISEGDIKYIKDLVN